VVTLDRRVSAMLDQTDLEELVAHLARSSRLDPSTARRLIDDVLSYLDEPPQAFVRRRHAALLKLGWRNEEAFVRIGLELTQRRFPAPAYSPRQLRRIVYG
jgi:hypothetical protein